MPSLQSKIIYRVLRLLNYKENLNKALDKNDLLLGHLVDPSQSMYKKRDIKIDTIHDRCVFKLQPKSGSSDIVILYLHGGAYVSNFATIHWEFIDKLIKKTKCQVIAPNYPLAPQASYKETYDMLITLIRNEKEQLKDKKFIMMGDSAGGGLALGLAQFMAEELKSLKPKLIMISPWLDVSMALPMLLEIDAVDPLLNIQALKKAGNLYAKDTPLQHPMISPMYGDLMALGDVVLFTGTYDMLFADAEAFHSKMKAAGKHIHYYVYDKMIHVWPLFSMPESKRTLDQIIKHINA